MTQKDRTEVREMIETTLGGWHSETVLREVTTNKALDNIDKHLGKLNGTVGKHQTAIDQNLPHTVANCVQTKVIREIRDNMISRKAVVTAILVAIPLAAGVFQLVHEIFKIT